MRMILSENRFPSPIGVEDMLFGIMRSRRRWPAFCFLPGSLAMATPRIEIAPTLVAEGKRLYESTMTTIADIAALMGVSRRTLENRIVEWNWKRRRLPSGAIDIFHAVRGAAAAVATATAETPPPGGAVAEPALAQLRAALALRIQNVVEREMAVIERVVGLLGPADEAEAERTMRTLAGISRTLREITALNQPDEVTPPDETDDDPVPRDIDEFRNELARRINALIDAERNEESGETGEASAALG
jgi:hypothetical protein